MIEEKIVKRKFVNWRHNGKNREREWNMHVFFDGTICKEGDLRPVGEFTKEDEIRQWEGALYDGRVKVHILAGWICGDCSEYEEHLALEGDEHLILKILPAVQASSVDQESERRKEIQENAF
jgi:hypothetical protein